MSDPNPSNDKPDELKRRLEALRPASATSAASAGKNDLPNLHAQKLLCILARLNTHHITGRDAVARNHDATEFALAEINERLLSKNLFIETSDSHRDHIVAVHTLLTDVQLHFQHKHDEILFRILAATTTLVVMILGLAAIVVFVAGGQR